MAKTGVITSPSGDDANMRTLGDTSPATGTLGSTVRAAFGLAAALKAAIYNFLAGTAVVVPTGAAAPTGGTLVATYTQDDPSKASSPWTLSAESVIDATPELAELEELVSSAKPSMHPEALVGKLEDLVLDPESACGDPGLVVKYDQADGLVKVYVLGVAYDPAAQYAENAAFVRTLTSTGARQPGE